MGKKLGLVVIGALLLTGCASGEPEAAPTVTVTATPEVVVPSEEAAPLAVQNQPAPTEDAAPADPEAAFLAAMDRNWMGELPASDELLAAGRYACAQFDAGLRHSDFTSVQGDSGAAMENNSLVNVNASRTLCPEHNTDN